MASLYKRDFIIKLMNESYGENRIVEHDIDIGSDDVQKCFNYIEFEYTDLKGIRRKRNICMQFDENFIDDLNVEKIDDDICKKKNLVDVLINIISEHLDNYKKDPQANSGNYSNRVVGSIELL